MPLFVFEALYKRPCLRYANPCLTKGSWDRDVWYRPLTAAAEERVRDKAGTWHVSAGDPSFNHSVSQLADLMFGKVLLLRFSFLSLYFKEVVIWILAKSSLSR